MNMKSWAQRNLEVLQANSIIRFMASVKLAVITMASLGAILAAGTIIESRYNGDMARLCVYDQWWFHLVLVFLFFNVLLAVVVRWPLRRSQYPFGCIHLGILLVLIGSVLTQFGGIDGSMEIPEGGATRALHLPENVVRTYVNDQLVAESQVRRTLDSREGNLGPVPGMPDPAPRVLEYLPFSRTFQRVVPDTQGGPIVELALLAVGTDPTTLRLGLDNPLVSPREDLGGLMALSLERAPDVASFLDTSSRSPARFDLTARAGTDSLRMNLADLRTPGRKFRSGNLAAQVQEFLPDAEIGPTGLSNHSDSLLNPAVRLRMQHQDSSWDEILYGRVPDFRFSGDRHPEVAWKVEFRPVGGASQAPLLRMGVVGDTLLARCEKAGHVLTAFRVSLGRDVPLPFGVLHLSVGAFEPHGEIRDSCAPVDPQPGRDLPPPAIRVGAGPWGASRWVPLGGVFLWNELGLRRALSFEGRRVSLPFGIRLDRFKVGDDPGTTQAATYTSYVHVVDSLGHPLDSARIAMNEPLKRGGFTFYQASFANDPGKTSTTVLSVNRDPGRFLKYFGALLAVLSIVWYVLERSRLGRRGKSE